MTTFQSYWYTFLSLPPSCIFKKNKLSKTICFYYSYAEVRAEQRRELGIEESNPEVTADKVST